MWYFGAKARLLRALDALAFYNDKGIVYARHTESEAQAVRAAHLARIGALVAAVGASNLPPKFLSGLESGAVATDGSVTFIELVRSHRS